MLVTVCILVDKIPSFNQSLQIESRPSKDLENTLLNITVEASIRAAAAED